MFEGGTFDKNSQTPTNQNLTITFTSKPKHGGVYVQPL